MAATAAGQAASPDGFVDAPPEPYFTDTRRAIELYEPLVYGLAVTHTRCRSDADDVYQNVFLTYHRKKPLCRNADHLKAWLINTALNCAKQIAASSWRTRVVPLTPEHAAALPDKFQFQTELQQAVFWALGQLPETCRAPLYLFYFEDWPVAQIAQALGIELGAAKMRLSRGRTMMRELLQGDVFDD
ncbi:MAG: sigma-70 family RNA polymerase sigma factor [Bifidobacteriaceae bacterium]|jgi:RNA polymerase sigma-70 factor (ECF subfamily)|nr:sigma-70 family RNA polymerase sigma factor [Bifidobacteriaceae bacterium]